MRPENMWVPPPFHRGSFSGAKMAASLVKNFLVGNLMPEKCYEQIFLTGNVHGEAEVRGMFG